MIFILTFFYSISTVLVPPEADNFIKKGLEFSYMENYDSAFYYFETVADDYPDHPSGYFFLAYLCDLYSNDLLSEKYNEEFERYSGKALELAEKLKESDIAAGHFYRGSMLFSKTLNYANRGDYIRALGSVTPAYYELSKALEHDPTLHDARLGIGAYKFLKGTLETSIFMNNSLRDEGIEEIEKCSENGSYLNVAAKNFLALLLLETGKINESIEISISLVSLYPTSRTFHWALLKAYKKNKQWENLIITGDKLVNLIKSGPEIPAGNLAYVYLEMAKANKELGNIDTAKNLCREILNLPLDDHTAKYKSEAQDILRKL